MLILSHNNYIASHVLNRNMYTKRFELEIYKSSIYKSSICQP